MITKIVFLCTLVAYSIIVSQSFMYILALRQVQLNLKASSYTEFRKLIDVSMRNNFKYVVYTALITNLFLVILTFRNPGSLLFIAATIAFIGLITDTLLMVKGNLPVNDIINKWTFESYPENWSEYREKWLNIFQYRQFSNIIGFISLLFGAVFGSVTQV